MERCDFCSAMKIIREYIRDEGGLDQSKILECLFSSFFQSNEGEYFDLDNGQVCRWLNGQTKLSPKISSYYLSSDHKQELANDIENEIVPLLVDMDMVIQRLYELVLHDNSISNTKKEMLFQGYPCQSLTDKADFLADILSFCME